MRPHRPYSWKASMFSRFTSTAGNLSKASSRRPRSVSPPQMARGKEIDLSHLQGISGARTLFLQEGTFDHTRA
jgi:hypothetical protein